MLFRSRTDQADYRINTIPLDFACGFTTQDPPRQEAKEVIAKLKEQGFKNIVMITGDNEVVANNVCKKLGINHCYSQVLPDGKYKIIEELKSQGKKVVPSRGAGWCICTATHPVCWPD